MKPSRLLLFAIKMVTRPFWAKIKNLRTRHCKPHKIANPGRINTIVSELERYDIGLLEYKEILKVFEVGNLGPGTLFDHVA